MMLIVAMQNLGFPVTIHRHIILHFRCELPREFKPECILHRKSSEFTCSSHQPICI